MTSSDAICTIITPDYADYAILIRRSLNRTGWAGPLFVLTTEPCVITEPGIRVLDLSDLVDRMEEARATADRYKNDKNRLRWSLKPVLLAFLIEEGHAEQAVFCDPDECFFQSPDPLFAELATGGVLLTPHWRPLLPTPSVRNFRLNFMDGLFNAGCVGANRAGLEAMRWWSSACRHACQKNYFEGLYDDQRYLDLLPIYFAETRIFRHYGFNLADWNLHLRQPGEDGGRPVPDRFPVSMVHFTKNTIKRIDEGLDPVLEPYLTRYRTMLDEVRQSGLVAA